MCYNPIIGSNIETSPFRELIVYQGEIRDKYSNYCGIHFCLQPGCRYQRISVDETGGIVDVANNIIKNFSEYCSEHCSKCWFCGGPVTIGGNKLATIKICNDCATNPRAMCIHDNWLKSHRDIGNENHESVCTGCGEVLRVEEHVFKKGNCIMCWASEPKECKHEKGPYWYNYVGSEGHEVVCIGCGEGFTVAEHVFVEGSCIMCLVSEAEECKHKETTRVFSDYLYHAVLCVECDKKLENEMHVWDNDLTCRGCGFVDLYYSEREKNCVHEEWTSVYAEVNNEYHEVWCSGCGLMIKIENHIYDSTGTCSRCGVSNSGGMGFVCKHEAWLCTYRYVGSEGHKVICTECGEVLRTEEHTYDVMGTCSRCGVSSGGGIGFACRHEDWPYTYRYVGRAEHEVVCTGCGEALRREDHVFQNSKCKMCLTFEIQNVTSSVKEKAEQVKEELKEKLRNTSFCKICNCMLEKEYNYCPNCGSGI